jgi:hypothetical protein
MPCGKESGPRAHVYKLIFFFAGLVFAPWPEWALVQILLVVATAPITQGSKTVEPWLPWQRSGAALLRELALATERDLPNMRALVAEKAAARGRPRRTRDDDGDGYEEYAFDRSHFAGKDPERHLVTAKQGARAIRHIHARFADLVAHVRRLPIHAAGPAPYCLPVSRPLLKEPTGPRGFLCLQDMLSQPAPPARRRLPETFTACGGHPGLTVLGKQVPQALPCLLQDLPDMAGHEHEWSDVQELRHGLNLLLDGGASAASPSPPSSEGDDGGTLESMSTSAGSSRSCSPSTVSVRPLRPG